MLGDIDFINSKFIIGDYGRQLQFEIILSSELFVLDSLKRIDSH